MAEIITPDFPKSLSGLLEEEYTRLIRELAGSGLRERARILAKATDYLLHMQLLGYRLDAGLAETIEREYSALLTAVQSDKDAPGEEACGLSVAERLNIVTSATAFLLKRRKLKRHDQKNGIDVLRAQFSSARRAGRR